MSYEKVNGISYLEFKKENVKKFGDSHMKEPYKKLDLNNMIGKDLDRFTRDFEKILCTNNPKEINLLKQQINSLCLYAGELFQDTNNYLRGVHNQKGNMNLIEQIIDSFSMMLEEHELSQNIICYRFIDSTKIREYVSELNGRNKFKKYDFWGDRGFVSTTMLCKRMPQSVIRYDKPIVLKLYVPKGVKGIYMENILPKCEYELILQPNLYFQVIGIKHNKILGMKEIKVIVSRSTFCKVGIIKNIQSRIIRILKRLRKINYN